MQGCLPGVTGSVAGDDDHFDGQELHMVINNNKNGSNGIAM
jgi:hypothetical protein